MKYIREPEGVADLARSWRRLRETMDRVGFLLTLDDLSSTKRSSVITATALRFPDNGYSSCSPAIAEIAFCGAAPVIVELDRKAKIRLLPIRLSIIGSLSDFHGQAVGVRRPDPSSAKVAATELLAIVRSSSDQAERSRAQGCE